MLSNTPTQNKPEIPRQAVCHRPELVISEQLPMLNCNTWLRSPLCDIKKFVRHRGVCYENVSLNGDEYVHDYTVGTLNDGLLPLHTCTHIYHGHYNGGE